jgi:hypothetical protein
MIVKEIVELASIFFIQIIKKILYKEYKYYKKLKKNQIKNPIS